MVYLFRALCSLILIFTIIGTLLEIWIGFQSNVPDIYLAHVIEKPNLRIPNPQYLQLFF